MLIILKSLLLPLIITFLTVDIIPMIVTKVRRNKAFNGNVKEKQIVSFAGPFKRAILNLKRDRLGNIALHSTMILILWFTVGAMFVIDPNFEYDIIDMIQKRNLGFFESAEHPFGTDKFASDIFSRTLHAGRTTLWIAFGATSISIVIGIAVGTAAGYFGGKVDFILSRIIEIVVSIPFLVFAIVIFAATVYTATDAEKINNVIFIFGLLGWPGFARLIRGQVKQISSNEYITATKSLGISPARTMIKHIVPGVMPYVLVRFTLSIAAISLSESALSFIGMGVTDPNVSWGMLLEPARDITFLEKNLNQWLPAAFMLFFTILSINLSGDSMSKAFNAKGDD